MEQVVWSERAGQWSLLGERGQENVLLLAAYVERLEVIGDVYSNPELLSPEGSK